MTTLEVVILSVLAGMAALALLTGFAVLIWFAWNLRKSLAAAQSDNRRLHVEIVELIEGNERKTKRLFEDADTTFETLKSETKHILDLHSETMKGVVSRINADAIVQNVNKFVGVCARLENAINTFHKLILDNLEVDRGQTEYEPEQPAPERNQFGLPASQYSVSPSAQYDADADREAAAEVTTQSTAG